jgi:hypothetical protein
MKFFLLMEYLVKMKLLFERGDYLESRRMCQRNELFPSIFESVPPRGESAFWTCGEDVGEMDILD